MNNEGLISNILRINPIATGSVLITDNLVLLKRDNHDPILTVKRIEWRKFVDCFGLIIEFNPVGKH